MNRRELAVALAVTGLLSACQKTPPGAEDVIEIEEIPLTVDATLSMEEDEVGRYVGESIAGSLPTGFPVGLPLPRPVTVTDFGSVGAGRSFVVLAVPSAAGTVRASWESLLRKGGWTGDGANRWSRDDVSVAISVSSSPAGAQLRVEYVPAAL